jgi:hypothetical protein
MARQGFASLSGQHMMEGNKQQDGKQYKGYLPIQGIITRPPGGRLQPS